MSKVGVGLAAVAACSAAIAASEVRWTGAGGDTKMTTSENWASAVDLTDGSVLGVFADAGTAAQVVGSMYLNGLKFDRAANFTVSAADSSAGLSLGGGGIASSTGIAYNYTISAPLTVVADQTWNTAQHKDRNISITGGVNSDAAHTITKTGTAMLIVSGGGNFTGDVTTNSRLQLQGANAFGAGAGTITVNESELILYKDATVNKNIYFNCGDGWNNNTKLVLWSGNHTIKGAVSFSNKNLNIYPYSGSCVTFEKGISDGGYLYLRGGSGGKLIFTKTPISLTTGFSFIESDVSTIIYNVEFAVAGNVMASLGSSLYPMDHAKVTTTVDWAFNNTKQDLFFKDDSVLDLCGTAQRVGMLYVNENAADGHQSVVTGSSATTSKLYLNIKTPTTPKIHFTGNLSVDFTGTYTTTINETMTATGEVSIQSGTLAFTENGSWANASKVTIENGAKVTTAKAGTFGASTEIALNGSGNLAIPSGVTEHVGFLSIDGEIQPSGTYKMGDGSIEVQYSGKVAIADSTLTVVAGDCVTLDEHTFCDGQFDKIVLGDAAKLNIQTAEYFLPNAAFALTIGEDAELTLADGIDLYVPTVSGATVGPGRHSSADVSWLKGDGEIYVPYEPIEGTQVRWTDGGSDNLATTPANWSGTVDLANGTSIAVLSDSGTEAVLAESAFFNGISFTKEKFNISAQGDNTCLRVASGGISSTANDCSIDAPVEIVGDQTWNLQTKLAIRGALMSDPLARYTLRKTGATELDVFGNNGTFAGSIELLGGSIVANGENPLGSSDGQISIGHGTSLAVANTVISKPVLLNAGGQWDATTCISVWGDHDPSEIKGKVTTTNGNVYTHIYTKAAKCGQITFSGGFESYGYPYFALYGGGSDSSTYSIVEFKNKPFVSQCGWVYAVPYTPNRDGISYKMYFDAPGNIVNNFGHPSYHFKCGEVHTTVDGAFDNANMPCYLDYDFAWDLHGTWQRVGYLNSYVAAGHRPPTFTNSTETAGTLYFTQSSDAANKVLFAGNMNVVMSGSKTLTINSAMTATGSITVDSGTMTFADGGSWRKATAVTVNGSGRINVARSRTFGTKAVMTLASASSLNLAEGVVQWVSKLVIGGTEHTIGEFVFGNGKIMVGTPGTVIILR